MCISYELALAYFDLGNRSHPSICAYHTCGGVPETQVLQISKVLQIYGSRVTRTEKKVRNGLKYLDGLQIYLQNEINARKV